MRNPLTPHYGKVITVSMGNELNIKAIREKLGGITQSALADALGVDQSTVSNWENGQRPRGPAVKLLLSLKKSDFSKSRESAR
jgi:DNA-binding transcriptional regulator YiaG